MNDALVFKVTGFFANQVVAGLTPLPFIIRTPLGVTLALLDLFREVGAGSDRVPITVTTADGSKYFDIRDPNSIWRHASDNSAVDLASQDELTRQWNREMQKLQ